MKCERFDKLIHLFLDGRLEKDEESKLEEHLSTCEECAQRLALLKSMEEMARKVEVEEPSQEYWDTFSSRVKEKIVHREEKSFAFGLKSALKNIFSFSPLKIKVAAGLASVVLVFIVGKLYVDYRGQEILPREGIIQTEEQPQLDVTKVAKKGEVSEAEDRDRVIPPPAEPKREKKAVHIEEAKKKATPPGELIAGEEMATEELGALTAPEVAEERGVHVSIPGVTDQAAVEARTPSEQPAVSPEAEQIGAGAQEKLKRVQEAAPTPEQEKVAESRDLLGEADAEGPAKSSIDLPQPTGFRASTATAQYEVNRVTIPRMQDDDTLMPTDELRKTLEVWTKHIEENPADSLNNQGYLQVAIGYYLLAKISRDTTVISEGSKLIETYLGQIAEPELKRRLSDRLEKIKALREK